MLVSQLQPLLRGPFPTAPHDNNRGKHRWIDGATQPKFKKQNQVVRRLRDGWRSAQVNLAHANPHAIHSDGARAAAAKDLRPSAEGHFLAGAARPPAEMDRPCLREHR